MKAYCKLHAMLGSEYECEQCQDCQNESRASMDSTPASVTTASTMETTKGTPHMLPEMNYLHKNI